MLKLVDVYDIDFSDAAMVLYELLAERPEQASISHKKMPTYERHLTFVKSRPYTHWWLLQVDGTYVGSAYLTDRNEIGLFIFKDKQGKGYGSEALALVRDVVDGPLLANIAPTNLPSQHFFYKHGFGLVQYTYRNDRR